MITRGEKKKQGRKRSMKEEVERKRGRWISRREKKIKN